MFWIQIIPLPKAEQSIIFLDTRPFTFRMAAFTARGTVRLMLLVMITASCFRLACTVASSRMAIKHEKSDTCTTMRASIAHEKGLKSPSKQQVQSNHQLVHKSRGAGPQVTGCPPKSIKGPRKTDNINFRILKITEIY